MTPRLAAAALLTAAIFAAGSDNLDDLYQSGRWFEFRDAMAKQPSPSPFYRGELALAFRDWPEAEKQLSIAMRDHRGPAHAFAAAMGLQKLYAFSGRWKDGRALIPRVTQMLDALRATGSIDRFITEKFTELRDQLTPLEGILDLSIVTRGQSRLQYAEVSNQLFVPLNINGAPANFTIDTGAEVNSISAAEAKRLGLQVRPATIHLGTFGTYTQDATGIAIANDLVIGNFHLRNVSFVVTADDDGEPGGLIGLPILFALNTLRWNSDGAIEFGFPAAPRNLTESNLALAGGDAVALIQIAGRPVTAILDTGAYDSLLLPAFATAFPNMVRNPLTVARRDIGNGAEDPRVASIAAQRARIGGLDVWLDRARVLSREPVEDSAGAVVWLGMDLFAQARTVTIDFAAMRLTLDGFATPPASAPGHCRLPPDFLCPPTWKCSARIDDDICYLDRLPAEAWPGNAIAGDDSTEPHCDFAEAAACARGAICSVRVEKGVCRIESEAAPEPPLRNSVSAVTPTPKTSTPTVIKTAPTTASDAEARDALQRSLKFESLDLSPARDYIYIEDQVTRTLAPDGTVRTTTSQTHEVVNLYDASFERLIRKDGEELPPNKARAEQARFDKAVDKRAHETAEAKAKRQEAERKTAAEDLACDDEFMKLFTIRALGSEAVNGRPAWIAELNPLPNTAPRCTALKTLTKLRMKIWIDQTEYRWARLEADNIAPVTVMKLLFRAPTDGMHMAIETERHIDGAWLADHMRIRLNAKLLVLAPLRADIVWTYSNYRKFQSEAHLLSPDGK